MIKDNDYGFSTVDDGDLVAPKQVENESALLDRLGEIENKLDQLLECNIDDGSDSPTIADLRNRLSKVESCILPLLNKLAENSDKAMINWPNRGPIIKQQIDRILSYTRT